MRQYDVAIFPTYKDSPEIPDYREIALHLYNYEGLVPYHYGWVNPSTQVNNILAWSNEPHEDMNWDQCYEHIFRRTKTVAILLGPDGLESHGPNGLFGWKNWYYGWWDYWGSAKLIMVVMAGKMLQRDERPETLRDLTWVDLRGGLSDKRAIRNLVCAIRHVKQGVRGANPAGIEWVKIPAGSFLYGDDQRPVSINYDYLIGKYPVTNSQFKLFLDTNPKFMKPIPFPHEEYNHPVHDVNWFKAVAFCEWNGCRLPTDMEWEKASRGVDGRSFPWGEKIDLEKANFNKNLITPVDCFPGGASSYGVFDTVGNLMEWTNSAYKKNPKYRVIRGGPFQITHREQKFPGNGGDIGFRCVLPIKDTDYRNQLV